MVVAFANGLLVSIEHGATSPRWTRFEGLADIVATSFLDLPPGTRRKLLRGLR